MNSFFNAFLVPDAWNPKLWVSIEGMWISNRGHTVLKLLVVHNLDSVLTPILLQR